MITLTQTTSLRLECPVCKQSRDEEAARDTATIVQTFGRVGYAVCPCCGQAVNDCRAPRRRFYRNRVDKFIEARVVGANVHVLSDGCEQCMNCGCEYKDDGGNHCPECVELLRKEDGTGQKI